MYLEEIMNTRVFKVFQRHVIACSYVLTRHSLLKTFPNQVIIFNKVHRNPLRRLGRGRSNDLEQNDLRRHRRI